MIKDGGLSFGTQLKIEFLPLNNGSKNCMGKSLNAKFRKSLHAKKYETYV